MKARIGLALACLALAAAPAGAQTSASFKLRESVINNGGNPLQGSLLTSSHFHIRLDAIGDAVIQPGLASASFHVDGGPVGRYPPPGEVTGLRFTTKSNLTWHPERSVGKYELYRGPIATLPGTFGACFAGDLADETASDSSVPAVGAGSFYLVTARNRLGEEGIKGRRSDGAEETNPAPCP